MDAYLTVKEAADVLHTHPQTVYRFVWAGQLPRINIGQGKSRPRFRIRRSAVDALMRKLEKGSKAA